MPPSRSRAGQSAWDGRDLTTATTPVSSTRRALVGLSGSPGLLALNGSPRTVPGGGGPSVQETAMSIASLTDA